MRVDTGTSLCTLCLKWRVQCTIYKSPKVDASQVKHKYYCKAYTDVIFQFQPKLNLFHICMWYVHFNINAFFNDYRKSEKHKEKMNVDRIVYNLNSKTFTNWNKITHKFPRKNQSDKEYHLSVIIFAVKCFHYKIFTRTTTTHL